MTLSSITEALDAVRDLDMSGTSVNGTNHLLDSPMTMASDFLGFRDIVH
jgi:hypothetical protein